MKKRIVSMLLSLTMVLSLCTGMTVTASAMETDEDVILNLVITDKDAEEITDTLTSPAAVAISKLTDEERTTATKLVLSTSGDVGLNGKDWSALFSSENFPNVTKIDATKCRCGTKKANPTHLKRIKDYQGIELPDIEYETFKYSEDHGRITEFLLPETVQMIDDYSLAGLGIETLTIPESVLILKNGAFGNCYSLLNIDIPDTVLYVGNYAFGLGTKTECGHVTVGQHVSYVDTNGFMNRVFQDYVVIQSSNMHWEGLWGGNDASKDSETDTVRIFNGSSTEKIDILQKEDGSYSFAVPAGSSIRPQYDKTVYYAIDDTVDILQTKETQDDGFKNHYEISSKGTVAINHYDETKGKFLTAEIVKDGEPVCTIESPNTSIGSDEDSFTIPAGSTITKADGEIVAIPGDGPYKSIQVSNTDVLDVTVDEEGKISTTASSATLSNGTTIYGMNGEKLDIDGNQMIIPAGSYSNSGSGNSKTWVRYVDGTTLDADKIKEGSTVEEAMDPSGKVIVRVGQGTTAVTKVKNNITDDDSEATLTITGGYPSIYEDGSMSVPAGSQITTEAGTVTSDGLVTVDPDNTITGAEDSTITTTATNEDGETTEVVYTPTENGTVTVKPDNTVTLTTENGTKYTGKEDTAPTVGEDGKVTLPVGSTIQLPDGTTTEVKTPIVLDNADGTCATHAWDKGVVTKEPTYQEKGVKTFTCTVCGETKEESIPKKRSSSSSNKPSVSVTNKAGGSAVASNNGTLTITPDEGYEIGTVTVNGKEVSVPADGKLTDLKPTDKVVVTFEKIKQPAFVDVPASAYYADAVAWAVANDITEGTSATTFSPDVSCTRAQMVTFLWRAAGSPAPKSSANKFVDVPADQYYTDAVLWALEEGVTVGTSATTFSPDMIVTRCQTVTALYRFAGSPAVSGNSFADVDAGAYYADAIKWAVANGITKGTSATTFSPNADCTRGQIVTFLMRTLVK